MLENWNEPVNKGFPPADHNVSEDVMSTNDLLKRRLELRIEQQRIHIEMLSNDAQQAGTAQVTLQRMLQDLAALEAKKQPSGRAAA